MTKQIAKSKIRAIEKEGFSILDFKKPLPEDVNGVIIRDGNVILCNGYMQHRYVYPLLCSLGLVESGDWTQDNSAIHISSCQLNGLVAHSFVYDPSIITDGQIDTLFALRGSLRGYYGSDDNVCYNLYHWISNIENHGGKYNGLAFLKRFYKNIRLPEFSKSFISGIKPICIRTSPVHSMPGLLNSKFDVTSRNWKEKVNEIVGDFSKHLNLIPGNEIYWFFQQKLEGVNGVCNVRGRDRAFSYSASATQGQVVGGKMGEIKLARNISAELKGVATELARDMGRSIQLEFVVQDDGKLFIVQFRVLKNEPEETIHIDEPEKALYFGKTFSRGYIDDLSVKDVLVVEEDGDSSLLLGKKALIVTKDVEFSHLLALSKALGIPSMYATGKIDFGKRKKIDFTAYNRKSWIL